MAQNIFLTDENVNGPAIEIARRLGVEIIRDVDIEIPCEIDDYDQCLFNYAAEQGYVLVTNNGDDFEWQFYRFAEGGQDHPGLVIIQPNHNRSSQLIADWLALWIDEPFTNRLMRIPPPF
jgi:hypothetical protein